MSRSTSQSSSRGNSSIFAGVLIGLAIGTVLAVGVALWVTGANPFRAGVPPAAPGVPAPATPEVAPSFDFYEVLPGGEPNALPTVPAVAPAPVVPRYFLQAGAFQNAADADNLKAQLALLGVEATIQTAEVAEKGVFHRVRVGPFAAMDEINHTRSLLAQNNIPVTLVTDEPPKQEIP